MGDEAIVIEETYVPRDSKKAKLAVCGLCLVLALISIFVLGGHFSSPEAYEKTIATLDAKKGAVMGLVAASTTLSAVASVIPGDAGKPVADMLVNLSSNLLLVLAAIYLEKYLLTIFGMAAFRVLIPVACVLVAAGVWIRDSTHAGRTMIRLASKLAMFGIALVLVVPASTFVSNMIDETYATSKETAVAVEDQQAEEEAVVTEETADAQKPSAVLTFFNQLSASVQNLPNAVSGTTEEIRNSMNDLIEAFAVMVVTSCAIPMLVIFFFIWLVQTLLGINLDVPSRGFKRRTPKPQPQPQAE